MEQYHVVALSPLEQYVIRLLIFNNTNYKVDQILKAADMSNTPPRKSIRQSIQYLISECDTLTKRLCSYSDLDKRKDLLYLTEPLMTRIIEAIETYQFESCFLSLDSVGTIDPIIDDLEWAIKEAKKHLFTKEEVDCEIKKGRK